jgi:hypothetical protein
MICVLLALIHKFRIFVIVHRKQLIACCRDAIHVDSTDGESAGNAFTRKSARCGQRRQSNNGRRVDQK